MARHWTASERARQAELIRQWQPWRNSTGPRSEAGKAKVAMNGFKGGERKQLRELARCLREQARELKDIETLL